MDKIIIGIDPGSPKNRDRSATTGIFVGSGNSPKCIETAQYEIMANNRDEGENQCALLIKSLGEKYKNLGHEVDFVIEEYKNYRYNGAANNFQKNHTSELIGKIKFAVGGIGKIYEQPTSVIKTKYSNSALEKLGIMVRVGNTLEFTPEFGNGKEISRHVRDACRHYLLRRDKLGMFNYLNGDIWDQL